MRRRTGSQLATSPLEGVDLVLADLDGVVYRGGSAIPHAVEALRKAAATLPMGYVTNNASRTPASVADQLRGFGLDLDDADVVTSPQAAVRLLAGLIPAGSTVLVVGGEGLTTELDAAGFRTTDSAEDGPSAVIQGFAPTVGWPQLAEAAYALQGTPGLTWVATNNDWTLPTERGIAPGNGTLVSAVHTATGRLPVTAGKPEVAIYEAAVDRFGGTNPLFLGDRLDTDILGANRAGMSSVLVLTGIDQAKQLLAAEPLQRPTFILDDLRGLHEPYAAPVETEDRRGTLVTAGSSRVRRVENRVVLESRGRAEVELVRAASAAVWGSGLAIYGIDVDPDLLAALRIATD